MTSDPVKVASGVIEGALHEAQLWNAEAGIEPTPTAEALIAAYAEITGYGMP